MSKEIAKAYEPAEHEEKIYNKWVEGGFFNPDKLKLEAGAKSYTIVMPPPNVTGTLHMGHASMLAYQDLLIRYHRMKGERTLWLPGTDHAAIATQTKVEKIIKDEGTSRHELGREKFLERVRQFAQESHDTIEKQVKKMGSSCDWTREAYTLDETRTKAVRSVFKMMYDDGLVYRGERIVNWCPRCKSTLADDEVEHKAQKAKLYTFKYSQDFPISIATTRPETKLGDTAVAVNPKDERYKEYIGQTFAVDFCGVKLNIKIIGDRHVDMEFGTGALGVTPAHSATDWQMAEENNLEIIKVIDEDGIIREGFGEFSGLDVKATRALIVEKLNKAGLIEKEEEVDNNLSICYRCDTTVEPLPSLQWFIDVNKKIERLKNKSIKELSVDAVRNGVFGRKKINIIPERFEKIYFNWMDNLKDWCISRQILFGHQVPVWYRLSDSKSQNLDSSGREIFVGVEAPEGEGWIQDTDTLDTWFSSGMWTFSTLANKPEQISIRDGKLHIDSDDFKNFHPTQVLETGYDIIFFWVARMIIMTTYAVQDIPFQDVYLHGLVLDDKGKKMSKSKGNVIDPLDMIPKYGTDATRMSLIIGSTPGSDLRLSEDKIAGFRNFTNKLWNISRFIIMSSESLKEIESPIGDSISRDELTIADKWIITKLNILIRDVSNDIDDYKFSQAGERLREFTWNDLADWYLEVNKFEKTKEKNEIMLMILRNILKLWHPFMPFVTEAIWEGFNDEALIVSHWPESESYLIDEAEGNQFNLIQEIIVAIRNARNENKVEPSKKVKAIIVTKNKTLIESQAILIQSLKTGIEEIEISEDDSEQKDAIGVVVGDIKIYLLGAIDKDKEKVRIQKEIENLERFVKVVESKMSNKEFIDRAPKEVVEREQATLGLKKEELEALRKQVENL
ncbi:MAG: valine--tRNA ligase [Candidatus Magasanikbacteria bacterium]|nr:valine--tRNA ligase [Candidatus Magasanikbacteria bacterium]